MKPSSIAEALNGPDFAACRARPGYGGLFAEQVCKAGDTGVLGWTVLEVNIDAASPVCRARMAY
jgi:hypothetical protein